VKRKREMGRSGRRGGRRKGEPRSLKRSAAVAVLLHLAAPPQVPLVLLLLKTRLPLPPPRGTTATPRLLPLLPLIPLEDLRLLLM